MTLWLLRPAWVSFKSDRNCRLQKLWLADKAICKETSSDACVCMGVRECEQETKPAPFARQAEQRKVLGNYEISSNPICRHEKCHQGETGCFRESREWDVSAFVGRLPAAQHILPVLRGQFQCLRAQRFHFCSEQSCSSLSFCLQHTPTAKYHSKVLTLIKQKNTGKSKKRKANL